MNDCKESYLSCGTNDSFLILNDLHGSQNAGAAPFASSYHYPIEYEKTYPDQMYRHIMPPVDNQTLLDLDNQSQQQAHRPLEQTASLLEINTSSDSNSCKSTSSSSSSSSSPVAGYNYSQSRKGKCRVLFNLWKANDVAQSWAISNARGLLNKGVLHPTCVGVKTSERIVGAPLSPKLMIQNSSRVLTGSSCGDNEELYPRFRWIRQSETARGFSFRKL